MLKYLHNLPHSDLYPALLVIDYNMPGMNGGELLMRLRMDASLQDIPVAMYSTGMRNLEAKLKTMGAEYCFEKGHQVTEVIALVEKLRSIVEDKETVEKQ
ncbi:MAG: response regulator [Chitinophagaceae bacterium]|nr:MAG: response regulator [Chitinophagaceae bacterium]